MKFDWNKSLNIRQLVSEEILKQARVNPSQWLQLEFVCALEKLLVEMEKIPNREPGYFEISLSWIPEAKSEKPIPPGV